MGNFKIIVPRATTNLMPDPIFAAGAGSWVGSLSEASGSAPPFLGSNTYRFNIAGASNYIARRTTTLPNTSSTYFASAWIWVPSDSGDYSSGDISIGQSLYTGATVTAVRTWDETTGPREEWYLIVSKIEITSDASGSIRILCDSGTSADYIEVGAVQIEEQPDTYTTLCYGSQPDSYWEGAENGSSSTRLADSRLGGAVFDLEDNLGLHVKKMGGVGFPVIKNKFRNLPQVDGQQFMNTFVGGAEPVLVANLNNNSLSNYHAARQDLIEAMRPSGPNGSEPFLLQYHGAGDIKEIPVRIDGGLNISKSNGFHEDMTLRFVSESPFWERPGFYGYTLDGLRNTSSGGIQRRSGRITADSFAREGSWDSLDLTNTSHGSFSVIHDILFDNRDGYVYVAGDFTGFGGVVGADYLVYYDLAAGSWNVVGSASDLNDQARCLAIRPEGGIYVGGDFTNVDGDSDADGIAAWTGSAWEPLPSDTGTASSTVAAGFTGIAVGKDGKIYVTGSFINLAGTGASGFAYYDPETDDWETTGSAFSTSSNGLAVAPNGDVYFGIGANSTSVSDGTAQGIVRYDGSSFYKLGTGIGASDIVEDIHIDPNGDVYVAGLLTEAGGITVENVAKWNGSGWSALGDGATGGSSGRMYAITRYGNDIIFGGNYSATSQAGGQDTPSMAVFAWDGSGIRPMDMYHGASGALRSLETVNDALFVGWDEVSSSIYTGDTIEITSKGTAKSYPQIYIKNNGAAANLMKLISIVNETTGQGLYFNQRILAEEEITLSLEPGNRYMESNYFGRNWRILPSSDVTEFYIKPGVTNVISAFFYWETANDVTMEIRVPSTFWGVD